MSWKAIEMFLCNRLFEINIVHPLDTTEMCLDISWFKNNQSAPIVYFTPTNCSILLTMYVKKGKKLLIEKQ